MVFAAFSPSKQSAPNKTARLSGIWLAPERRTQKIMSPFSFTPRLVAALFAALVIRPSQGFFDAAAFEDDMSFVQTSAVVSTGNQVAGVRKECRADHSVDEEIGGSFDIDLVGFMQTSVQVTARPSDASEDDANFDAFTL
ncbi:unnamed protein product [Prorocentrum cordatum]|uniref:Uncharacterized protein n=1 Tax=Prorocentrum cordatum TaxID=2364126 RepID=A0ABN9XMV6_9DINO|nr:unnamed protein product [Polarella glacialis]